MTYIHDEQGWGASTVVFEHMEVEGTLTHMKERDTEKFLCHDFCLRHALVAKVRAVDMADTRTGLFAWCVELCGPNTLLDMYYLMEHLQEIQKVGVASIFSSHTDTLGHRKVMQFIFKHSLWNCW